MIYEKSLVVVTLVTQLRELSAAVSIPNIAGKRGRPPNIATLLLRAQASTFASTRPAYAQRDSTSENLVLTAMLGEGSFNLVRNSLGLHHKAIPDSLVLDVLALDEAPDSEYEMRHPDRPTHAALQERVVAELESKKIEITNNAKRAGEKVAPRTQRSQIEAAAPELLQDLAHQRITPETMQTRLRNLPVVLPIPSVRSLRRMAQQKRGQKPTPK